jgi:hypothetical protein
MVVGMCPVALKFSETNMVMVRMAFTDAAFQVFIGRLEKAARAVHTLRLCSL